MCAPASVTALHQVISVSAFQAYLVSHIMGVSGVAAATLLCFKGSVVGKLSKLARLFR